MRKVYNCTTEVEVDVDCCCDNCGGQLYCLDCGNETIEDFEPLRKGQLVGLAEWNKERVAKGLKEISNK